MSDFLKRWVARKCCCHDPDRYECARMRERQQHQVCHPHGEDDDPCECLCHDQDYDDEGAHETTTL